MSQEYQEIDDNQVMDPLNDEEAKEFYRNALIVALENNNDVNEFCLYGQNGLFECDILVNDSTENIDNEMYNLDMSKVIRACDINSSDVDFEFDHLREWQENYESGLVVTVSLIPHRIYDLDEEFRWCPVHPYEILSDKNHSNIYEGLAYLFGGDEEDYMVEDNTWVERATKELEKSDNSIVRDYLS